MENEGWSEWSKYTIKELERLGDCVEKIMTDISDIKTQLELLKYKSGLWGAGASLVTSLLVFIVAYITGHIK